ncbi:MAG TPA: PRC-barrel domain-containing protein [Solirubrobacteraceae bacterium]|nr:PRC-barrel domain-containing protein [Solirubrobacteraceae bacterium]
MAGVEQISEWLGQEVVDVEGESLGKLEDVYYAREEAEPRMGLVKSGLFGRKHTFVPLQGATVGREHVRIAYTSQQIAQASDAVELDPGERLAGASAQQLAGAYGVQLAAEDLDSANALEQRRAAAQEAEEHAAKLEAEAQQRAQGADEAQTSAREQSAQAEEAAQAAREARAEAERLRP